ncbi:MAG: cupin domain-containing protein [Peptococcaceae bacterium]|nr:cupin domain-containing protein [Peptococcaceae bacterium]
MYQKDIVDRGTGACHFTFHLSLMEEGGNGSLHSHPHSEHLLMVLKGELKVRNPIEECNVPEGSAVLIYPGEEHEIINVFPGLTKYIVVYSPPR